MRQKIVLGNWKMNGRLTQIIPLIHDLLETCSDATAAQVAVLVPAIYLPEVSTLLTGRNIGFGAQNVYPKDSGAYTGELSGLMLADYHCQYVLVGHSERRQLFHEDEKFVAEKFHHVKEHAMIPILCVGETEKERDGGLMEQRLSQQLAAVFEHRNQGDVLQHCIVAYEPIWAIGTGNTATPEQAQHAHAFIRQFLSQYDQHAVDTLPILYGGSVNAHNAPDLFAMSDVDGGLVGGASLDAKQFGEIVKCINCC
ncbi:MAG: triose-phosphate isomerase [Gammaproteobacteria bacterium]|nr:triose-phosphate isomerase [Gammaproteobacteria bacterium]